ncbi:hypothetical protein N473_01345 [Pseudoalteromonas luteoviolacea CPMOR-1]|uniref:Phytanoyl-CoA dioxygenase n=1 Tax=Pseudoalteromonas luteoviolacea CPMOR-1 TaxID=1365248 RepID=A0A162BPQ2_9GAMM|nr:phytanoyl-CoA dioxygenase family protein [Pseudoalteromonas luteoviolacea]KZN65247.1 hypothetical protein N473_01345 [Pseudoalteromonas luteoviolacea CPMOR-1]
MCILLDDVDYLSGPLWLIPGSHLLGDISMPIGNRAKSVNRWANDTSETLSYQVPSNDVNSLLENTEPKALVGKAGDVIFFHPQVVHCSSNNLSSVDRRLLIITYNQKSNAGIKASSRPEFLSSRLK